MLFLLPAPLLSQTDSRNVTTQLATGHLRSARGSQPISQQAVAAHCGLKLIFHGFSMGKCYGGPADGCEKQKSSLQKAVEAPELPARGEQQAQGHLRGGERCG